MNIRSWTLRNQLLSCLLDTASTKRLGGPFKVFSSPILRAVLAPDSIYRIGQKKGILWHPQVMREASREMKKMCYNFEIDGS
jgi:hypothetical protein